MVVHSVGGEVGLVDPGGVSCVGKQLEAPVRLLGCDFLSEGRRTEVGALSPQAINVGVSRAEVPDGDGPSEVVPRVDGIVLVDIASGDVVRRMRKGPCVWLDRSDDEPVGSNCGDHPGPRAERSRSGSFSSDGSLFALGGDAGYVVVVWDLGSGDIVHFVDSLPGGSHTLVPGASWSLVEFSPSGGHSAIHQFLEAPLTAVLSRIDTETWEVEATFYLEQL